MIHFTQRVFQVVAMLAAWACLGACDRNAGLRPADVVGIWRIERAWIYPRNSVPDTFYELTLILKADGRFTAKNVPGGLFLDWPAAAERTGSWALSHQTDPDADKLTLEFAAGTDSLVGVYDTLGKVNRGKFAFRLSGPGYIFLTREK